MTELLRELLSSALMVSESIFCFSEKASFSSQDIWSVFLSGLETGRAFSRFKTGPWGFRRSTRFELGFCPLLSTRLRDGMIGLNDRERLDFVSTLDTLFGAVVLSSLKIIIGSDSISVSSGRSPPALLLAFFCS